MSRTVSRQFGSSSGVTRAAESAIVYNGTIDDASEVVLVFEPGGMYELFTAEYTTSSGAYRGHRQIDIKVPEADVYGTVACAYGNAYASSNSGVTVTYNADSTVTIKRSNAAYSVIYVVRAVGLNIGNPSSAASAAESARDQAQAYAEAAQNSATAAAASETAAESAVTHYPKIESGYWYVWDGTNQEWLNTGVQAEGTTGATPNLTVGSVTTLPAGSSASATITGTTENPVLNLSIPRGNPGGLVLANNVTVATTDWAASAVPISSDFPYEATVSILGVTTGMIPDVIFGVDDSTGGNYAPIADSVANGITIYAREIPSADITIPTIMVHEV